VRTWLSLFVVLGLAIALLAAPGARAQEAEQVAQAQEAGQEAGAAEPEETEAEPAEPEAPPAPDRPAARPASGIEEIVVIGSEGEGMADFEAADSVTGFGAEDLAALGAQDIADLAGFTPNLEIVTGGATTPTFFIRGVGLNDFNANSTGAVAIYQDDVAVNAPALQLGSLFDVETVNVLRGPQGTGLARNASAGAIKVYSRKPTGEFGAFLRSDLGDYNFRDFEGALEAPIYEDLFAGRFAFRLSERDGTMENGCGGAPPMSGRVPVPIGGNPNAAPWSICGEPVQVLAGSALSTMPEGLPDAVNDIGNWAARGTILVQPTLDISLLLNAHGSRRNEWSRLGQSYGTNGFTCLDGDLSRCFPPPNTFLYPTGTRIEGTLGGPQGTGAGGYQPATVRARLAELAPCFGTFPNTCNQAANRASANAAKVQVARELAEQLDADPWHGDFNMCTDQDGNRSNGTQCQEDFGRTINDTWGTYLKGEVALPGGLLLTSLTGYDNYDRLIDTDLDFSPETLFQIRTKDDGWQVAQDLRLEGAFDELPLRWDLGGWLLREQLNVNVVNDLGSAGNFAVGTRDYTQELWSAAGYLSLAFDFWERFTLDGGFRYNWEQKQLFYALEHGSGIKACPTFSDIPQAEITKETCPPLENTWHAPTGTVRLTYSFREDTHAFWKYTRGWKPGTYNATSALLSEFGNSSNFFANISVATPETIDAFETGVRGSWLDGRLGADFSLFYYSYQDYQLFTAQQFSGGQPEFVILNAENAEVYGAELDTQARPWTGAFLNLRVGWLESQFLDFVQIQQEIVRIGGVQRIVNRELQNTGHRLLNSPEFKVSITAEQTLPLGRWGALTARYDGVWTDVTYYDATEGRGIPNVSNVEFLPEETIAQPAFWLHNLRLAYRLPGGQIEIAGWVRNLTNEAYKTFAFDGSTFNATTIYFVGDPRTIGGSVVFNF
jgi:outer membrane receptor protein involved in Fe transport